mmetsp:Transcript_129644/g.415786  ORF Transcript_129644/g.415786 Transcript_129644/m.415786 type:complete len:232 (+) Transcript_129644:1455-2150(+)
MQGRRRQERKSDHLQQRSRCVVPARSRSVPPQNGGEHLLLTLHLKVVAAEEADHPVQRPGAKHLSPGARRKVRERVALQHIVEVVNKKCLTTHDEGRAQLRRHVLDHQLCDGGLQGLHLPLVHQPQQLRQCGLGDPGNAAVQKLQECAQRLGGRLQRDLGLLPLGEAAAQHGEERVGGHGEHQAMRLEDLTIGAAQRDVAEVLRIELQSVPQSVLGRPRRDQRDHLAPLLV